MWYTYVIKSKKDCRWHTGITDDLRKRLSAHNSGKVPSTKTRAPFELIYYEACTNQDDAVAREKYLKSGMGKRYLKNRLKRFLSFTPLEKNSLTGRAIPAELGLTGYAPSPPKFIYSGICLARGLKKRNKYFKLIKSRDINPFDKLRINAEQGRSIKN